MAVALPVRTAVSMPVPTAVQILVLMGAERAVRTTVITALTTMAVHRVITLVRLLARMIVVRHALRLVEIPV